jgi:hypothetical protein
MSSEERAHTQTVCPTVSSDSCLILAPDSGRTFAQSPNSCSLPSSILVTRLPKIPPPLNVILASISRSSHLLFAVSFPNDTTYALLVSLIPPAGRRSDLRGLIHFIILTSAGGLKDWHSIPRRGRNLSIFCSVQTRSRGPPSL